MEENDIFGSGGSPQECQNVQINEKLEETKEENKDQGVEEMFDDLTESNAQSQEDSFEIFVHPQSMMDEDEVNEQIPHEDAHEDSEACEILEENQDPDSQPPE